MAGYRSSLVAFALVSVSIAACGRSRGTLETRSAAGARAESRVDSYKSASADGTTRLVWAENSGTSGARCWRSLEVIGRLPEPGSFDPRLGKPLNSRVVADLELLQVLEGAARGHLPRLAGSAAKATGACATAIPAAVAAIGSLLVPGAQPISPLAFALLLANVVGCGITAKDAAEAGWSAWSYHWLQSNLDEADVAKPRHDLPREALDALIQAVATVDRLTTNPAACRAP